MSDHTTPLIGKVHTDPQGRDAVHIAVAPCVADGELRPGAHVVLVEGSSELVRWRRIDDDDYIGIVDPFLLAPVKKGQRFYVFLRPLSITGLRHVWTHDKFPIEATETAAVLEMRNSMKQRSERWMNNLADRIGVSYTELMEVINEQGDDGGSLCFSHETDIHEAPEEMWDHAEVLLGRKFTRRGDTYFRCAC